MRRECIYAPIVWVLLFLSIGYGGTIAHAQTARQLIQIPTPETNPPWISARAAVLIDAHSGEVLWEKNAEQRRDPASTTKIMTALLAIEDGQMDEPVVVSRRAASTPGSSMGLNEGDRYVLRDLLKGLLIRSGNDAAVAIAEHMAGSVEAFVAQMNTRASQLDLRQTRFRNPHGLTAANHYSSALDLALLTMYAQRYPLFRETVCTLEDEVCGINRHGQSIRTSLRNTNQLLFSYEWADGVKTGTTSAAGQCLVASAEKDDQRLIVVVLNSGNRWEDARRLFEWGFDSFTEWQVAEAGKIYTHTSIRGGVRPTVRLAAARDMRLIFGTGRRDEIAILVNVDPRLEAPVETGQTIGSLTAVWNQRVLERVPLVAAEDVAASLWYRLYRTVVGVVPSIGNRFSSRMDIRLEFIGASLNRASQR